MELFLESALDNEQEPDFILYGDSLENIEESITEDIYTAMPSNKWGWPWSSGYNSTYVVKISFMGKSLYWHKWAVVPLMKVQERLLAEGWDSKYYWTDLQTWNKRMIAGTQIPSNHSWPTAIDINPSKNPYRSDNKLVTDIPVRVREIFKANGFRWGGDYNSVKDAMHFEYLGEPIKDYTYQRVLKLTTPYMSGNDVAQSQEYLKWYNYNISADGIFGPHTDACVRSFQASKMLEVDGIVGKNTWAELMAKKDDRILLKGIEGNDVLWVQKAINKIMDKSIDVDGKFGSKTEHAVRSFQGWSNIEKTGEVNRVTWRTLRFKSN